jgi:drug/metabolite transporter (DMT)-like permease
LLPFVIYSFPSLRYLSSFDIFLVIVLGLLWTYVAWAGNLSIAQNNFSFKEIIRQTRIIWVVLAGIFLLGETLQLKDYLGILLIILSVYIISYKAVSFKEHISSKPILLAWSVAFVAAAIAILEKFALNTVDITFYAFLMYLLPTLFLSLFLNKKRMQSSKTLFKNNKKEIIICSLLMTIAYFSSLSAYKLLPISLAYPLIQSSTAVGVLVGTFMFEENKDWKKKFIAAVIAVIGVVIIKLL